MDSHLVVGVGNIYASESLFRAGINPKTPANKVSRVSYQRLAGEIKATLAAAIESGGSSLRDFFWCRWQPGIFSAGIFRLWAYWRAVQELRHRHQEHQAGAAFDLLLPAVSELSLFCLKRIRQMRR